MLEDMKKMGGGGRGGAGREGGKKISEEGIYHECHVYLYDST